FVAPDLARMCNCLRVTFTASTTICCACSSTAASPLESNYFPRLRLRGPTAASSRWRQSALLLAYKIKYPGEFFLLRGNPTSARVSTGSTASMMSASADTTSSCGRPSPTVSTACPIAAIIDTEKIFCCHGGLVAGPADHGADQAHHAAHGRAGPGGLLCGPAVVRPADKETMGWGENDRGSHSPSASSCHFARRGVWPSSCTSTIWTCICPRAIRSVVEDGYEFFAKRQLILKPADKKKFPYGGIGSGRPQSAIRAECPPPQLSVARTSGTLQLTEKTHCGNVGESRWLALVKQAGQQGLVSVLVPHPLHLLSEQAAVQPPGNGQDAVDGRANARVLIVQPGQPGFAGAQPHSIAGVVQALDQARVELVHLVGASMVGPEVARTLPRQRLARCLVSCESSSIKEPKAVSNSSRTGFKDSDIVESESVVDWADSRVHRQATATRRIASAVRPARQRQLGRMSCPMMSGMCSEAGPADGPGQQQEQLQPQFHIFVHMQADPKHLHEVGQPTLSLARQVPKYFRCSAARQAGSGRPSLSDRRPSSWAALSQQGLLRRLGAVARINNSSGIVLDVGQSHHGQYGVIDRLGYLLYLRGCWFSASALGLR
uniref:protein-serine/threonine phosphatase n=1 Tax=Macrostomum lignano TaxID=282301 RepID=A0A1I8FNL0_9PLAT